MGPMLETKIVHHRAPHLFDKKKTSPVKSMLLNQDNMFNTFTFIQNDCPSLASTVFISFVCRCD